jgi:hypothetical protein
MKMLRFVLAFLARLTLASAQAQVGLPFPGPGTPHTTGGGGGTPTFIQGNTRQNGSGAVNSASVTLGSAVGSSHMVIAAFCGAGMQATDTVSFTDNATPPNTYTDAIPIFNAAGNYGCFTAYALNVANAPTIITGTDSTSLHTFMTMVAEEYSNVALTAALDGTGIGNPQSNPALTADTVTSTALTTTANGDLIWCFGVSVQSSGFSVGSGFTGHQAAGTAFYTESQIQSTAGSIAGTYTALATGDFTVAIALPFKHI